MGAQAILSGHAATVIAAGTESMTNCPLYFRNNAAKATNGSSSAPKKPMPPSPPVSGVVRDGLTDPYGAEEVMGLKAEYTARQHGLSRQAQDEAARDSFQKLTAAYEAGWMTAEIASLSIERSPGVFEAIDRDETLAKVAMCLLTQRQTYTLAD